MSRTKSTKNDKQVEDSTLIQWHPGFVAAMFLELRDNDKDLEHKSEYELNTKPIKMDLLVIKKRKKAVIKNNIGKIFRTHNILEYKSPGAALNIDTFSKVMGYAYLYKSRGERVNAIPMNEITVSLVRKEKPVGLIKSWKDEGYAVHMEYPGIYYVRKDGAFPTQLIVTKELVENDHLWLQSLEKGGDAQLFYRLQEARADLVTQGEIEAFYSVLDVAWAAKDKEDDEMQRIMKSITKERERIAAEAATENTINSMIINMHKMGMKNDVIADVANKSIAYVEKIINEGSVVIA